MRVILATSLHAKQYALIGGQIFVYSTTRSYLQHLLTRDNLNETPENGNCPKPSTFPNMIKNQHFSPSRLYSLFLLFLPCLRVKHFIEGCRVQNIHLPEAMYNLYGKHGISAYQTGIANISTVIKPYIQSDETQACFLQLFNRSQRLPWTNKNITSIF